MLLTVDQILAAEDAQYAVIEVPEWGGDVRLRGLTGSERDAFESEMHERKGKKVQINMRNFRARLIALCAVDGQGNRLFSHQQVEALGSKSARAIERLFTKALELSGLRDEDVAEMTEDFDDGQSADSSSV